MSKRTTLENGFYDLFERYFQKAERHRRWNVFDDIPWDKSQKNPNADVANLVESFYAVEMYLPDFMRHILTMVRKSRGRAWFQCNWGYEEMKHSMALERWLLASGARSQEQLYDFESALFDEEWTLLYGDEQLLSLCYTVLQEFATGTTYKRLKNYVEENNLSDPALSESLSLLHRDEVAHFTFFKDALKLYMTFDRDRVLEAMSHVLMTFQMPANHLVPNWAERDVLIQEKGIMTDRVFLKDIVRPVFKNLDIEHAEMRAVRRAVAERQRLVTPSGVVVSEPTVAASS